ncbi:dihydromonapterin reductase [Sansalvadorimonas verongulae]|uniref:dihydromonapterin reductase n=1 Tax=Sansalvadorimonas verongulae TaxID=2172824 RepID=UPI0012BC2C23|nr:dihydromonapterin reductase [Sansalvadorimonas verongulae]MTI12728.1 dihydromonapterin reductase [Sansalvadorimonas verongulae]
MSEQVQSVLITGASRRIGLFNARKLIESGFQVLATYRTYTHGVRELEDAGAQMIQCDLSIKENTFRLINEVRQHTSSLRAIIHNASGWLADSQHELDTEPMEALFHVHMEAPWLINRGLRDLLSNSQETADIIHMTDYNALRGSEHHAAYAATKAGLESLTRSFARLYAPGVKVNAIAPYLIIMNEDDREMAAEDTLRIPPMGLEPGESVIWQTLEYVLNNPYITGTTIPVDGGMSLS